MSVNGKDKADIFDEYFDSENAVIIDGINVSECEFYCKKPRRLKGDNINDVITWCQARYAPCSDCDNCYFKQLQRLKAENEKLKKENTILELITEPQREEIQKYRDKALQFKQALENVGKIAQYHIDNCCMLESCYHKDGCGENCYPKTSDKVTYCCYENIGQILDKINEVLE